MKILFLRAYDFPIGGAPQNRLIGLCKGLLLRKHDVEVHQFGPSKLHHLENKIRSMDYNGIRIYHHASQWSPVRCVFEQYLGIAVGIASTIKSILRSFRVAKIDYIFINSEFNLYTFIFWCISKLIGAKLGRDLNEYPNFLLHGGTLNNYRNQFSLKTNYLFYDSVIFITSNLEKFYRPYLKSTCKSIIIPATVDEDRFDCLVETDSKDEFITYCGDLSQDKDGVEYLLQAFNLLNKDFNKIKLKLIGRPNNMLNLSKMIEDLGLVENIVLTDYIHPIEIPKELMNSKLLVLARPSNLQAQGGFPTKLVEYLMTGKPVVITDVGEISAYLTDGVSCYLAKPDDVQDFYQKMQFAIMNYSISEKIGICGREVALKYFSHKSQGGLLSSFLEKNLQD